MAASPTTAAAPADPCDPRDPFAARAVEAFLYREARLADEHAYDDWLALWLDEPAPLTYWVPSNEDDYDPNYHLSIIYDDRGRLNDRVDRLKSGGAWAQEPRSRLRRLISNIEIGVPAEGVAEVSSNFILGESRRGRQRSFYARQIHRLHATPAGLRMASKKILLIDNDEPIHNLSFLV